MMTSDEGNIDEICKRVKQLLKDLFAAHVELTIEAKKWKKKYFKIKNKSHDDTGASLSIFNASNHSSYSNGFFESPLKDTVQHGIQGCKNSLIKNTVPEKLSQLSKRSVDISPSKKKNIETLKTNSSLKDSGSLTNVNDRQFGMENKCKKSIQKSPCKLKAHPSKNECNSHIIKSPGTGQCSILDFFDMPSDSERDFQSPENVVPSWKRRELSKPPLIIPDTEMMDCEEYDMAMSTPKKINEQEAIKSDFKTSLRGISPPTTRQDSSNAAEHLREFISPSPKKKKPFKLKAAKRDTAKPKTEKIKKKLIEDDFSIFDHTLDWVEPKSKRNIGHNVNKDKSVTVEEPASTHEVSSVDVTNDNRHGIGIEVESSLLETSAFDPDETYCPIMREKELMLKQQKDNARASLQNASMQPGIRLSQYSEFDLDETIDPNRAASGDEPSSDASICLIETPPYYPDGNSQGFDQESQELMGDGHRSVEASGLEASYKCKSELNSEKPSKPNTKEDHSGKTSNDGISGDKFKKTTLNDSFNKVPLKRSNEPEYAHVDVVRKKNERRKLEAFVCEQCKKWYDAAGLSEEERKERMKSCRHRAKFQPTSTPEHYWSIGFPDTEVCKERGYLEVEDENKPVVNRGRRKRAYKKMF